MGDKSSSLAIAYGIIAALSVFLAIANFLFINKKDKMYILLFSSVAVVNIGYLALSTASTVDLALTANRISYAGSVFLPFSMFMIITRFCRLNLPKWLPIFLIVVNIAVFLIAASPGYLDIYYKSVSIETVNNSTVLIKEYGPWHSIYLFFLLGYFSAIIAAIVYAKIKHTIDRILYLGFLSVAVFVNIGVWFLEQCINITFEMLSVSYIISEMFLLCLYMLNRENERILSETATCETVEEVVAEPTEDTEFSKKVATLTKTEFKIYTLHSRGVSTRDILKQLGITENTLKYHNRNIYGKLDVSSKKELLNRYVDLSADNYE